MNTLFVKEINDKISMYFSLFLIFMINFSIR